MATDIRTKIVDIHEHRRKFVDRHDRTTSFEMSLTAHDNDGELSFDVPPHGELSLEDLEDFGAFVLGIVKQYRSREES